MTPRMLLKAQAQGHTSQCVLNQTSMKIDYCGSFVPSGLASLFARGAKTPFLAMFSNRFSARLEKKRYIRVKLALLPSAHTHKPFPGVASKAVCGGVA